MSYKPTTAKYVGKTKTYYIVYKQTYLHNYRGVKHRRTQTRVKRVYISGKLVKVSKGVFKNKLGRKVYGVKFVYKTPVKSFIAVRDSTRYRQPRKVITVTKIVEIPRNAKNVRITTRPPKGPLMDID